MKNIIIIGPAYPLRGGISDFNERLCQTLIQTSSHVSIFSFSLQYPSFLFPGRTQLNLSTRSHNLEIHSIINSINPFNWMLIGNKLRKLKPDIIIIKFWIPFMAPCYGTITRIARLNRHTTFIAIVHNIISHEQRLGDKFLTRYFLNSIDGVITMSEKVKDDFISFNIKKPYILEPHPLYDNYGEPIDKDLARKKTGLPINGKIVLFFGFIRPYKGLDLLLNAIAILKNSGTKLSCIIAGEFYEDDKPYLSQIKKLQIKECVVLHDHFIPNEQIPLYFSAADVIVQPYKSGTQSGITAIAYHFNKPVVVTSVGGISEIIQHDRTGYICEPNPESVAIAISAVLSRPPEYFSSNIENLKRNMSWENMAKSIFKLCEAIKKS